MLRILLLLLPLCLANLLPDPSGPYQLTLNVSQLIDTSRKDPWGKDTIKYRRLMISRFDPLPPNTCYRKQKVQYMSPAISAVMDSTFSVLDLPAGMFGSLDMVLCFQPDFKPNKAWPIVLLSPGFNGTRPMYHMLAQEVASQGYTVIIIDHPFDTTVEFPDGTIAVGGNANFSDINSVYHALDVRMNDISFVLNTLGIQYNAPPNASVLGVGGSFGGAAIAAAMMNDTRICGGVNMDGEIFGGVINAGLGRPGINQSFVLWGAEGHNSTSQPEWGTFYQNLKKKGMFARELELLNAAHLTFSDIPLIADVVGVRASLPPLAQTWVGSLPGKRVLQILSKYFDDYFKFVLRGNEGELLLDGPSKEYPEVVVLG